MPVGEWKSEEIDALLELILPCKDELEYQRCLVTFAAMYDKPAAYGLDEVDQLLRRRANRYQDYTPPQFRKCVECGGGGCISDGVRQFPDDAMACPVCGGWGHENHAGRSSRKGLPWTYAERRLLNWAKNPNPSESKAEPTPEYLAGILCRPVEEVAATWYAGPGGIKGFFPPF